MNRALRYPIPLVAITPAGKANNRRVEFIKK